MTPLAELLPCPLCGSTDLFEDTSYTGTVITCDDCTAKASRSDWQNRIERAEAEAAKARAEVGREIVAWLRRDDFNATADALAAGEYKESQP